MRLWSEITGFVIVVLLLFVGTSLLSTMLGRDHAAQQIVAETGKCPVSPYDVFSIECR